MYICTLTAVTPNGVHRSHLSGLLQDIGRGGVVVQPDTPSFSRPHILASYGVDSAGRAQQALLRLGIT